MMFNPLSTQMQKLYGVSQSGFGRVIFAIASALLVGGVIVLFVLRVLKKINKMTAVKALTGNLGEEKKKGNKLGIAFVIILAILMLFVRMIISNQRYQISIKKALGFQSRNVQKCFCKSCFLYVIIGIAFGTFCGCTLGERICGMALQSLGAVGFKFDLNIWQIIMNMILGGLAAISAVYLGSNGIKSIEAVECCRGKE